MFREMAPNLITLGVNILLSVIIVVACWRIGRRIGRDTDETVVATSVFHTIVKLELEAKIALHNNNVQAATVVLQRIKDLRTALPPQPLRPRTPGSARVPQR